MPKQRNERLHQSDNKEKYGEDNKDKVSFTGNRKA